MNVDQRGSDASSVRRIANHAADRRRRREANFDRLARLVHRQSGAIAGDRHDRSPLRRRMREGEISGGVGLRQRPAVDRDDRMLDWCAVRAGDFASHAHAFHEFDIGRSLRLGDRLLLNHITWMNDRSSRNAYRSFDQIGHSSGVGARRERTGGDEHIRQRFAIAQDANTPRCVRWNDDRSRVFAVGKLQADDLTSSDRDGDIGQRGFGRDAERSVLGRLHGRRWRSIRRFRKQPRAQSPRVFRGERLNRCTGDRFAFLIDDCSGDCRLRGGGSE